MSLDAMGHLLSILNTPLLPVIQSIVDEGTIQLVAVLAQRDTINVSAYWRFLELVTTVAPYHVDVLLEANVPTIIFSKMAQRSTDVLNLHNISIQEMSMRALSAIVHERNGPGTTIDFSDEAHDMECVFCFMHMQPRLPDINAACMLELLMQLTVKYPETVARMCAIGLIRTVNEIMLRGFPVYYVETYCHAVSLFEALASDTTNLRALASADPYCTLRVAMQRFPEQIDIQVKGMRTIAALADFNGTARRGAVPANIIALVLHAMRTHPGCIGQCAGVCAIAKLLHSWRNVNLVVTQGGVFLILRALDNHIGDRELMLAGLNAIDCITLRIKTNGVLTRKVQRVGVFLVRCLLDILDAYDDLSVLRQVLRVFSNFFLSSPEMRELCRGLGRIEAIIHARQLGIKDKKMAQKFVHMLGKV